MKLIPKALDNPQLVLDGWLTDIKLRNGDLPDDQIEEILRRRTICETCPSNSKNAIAEGWFKTNREDPFCIHCGCPLLKLTASLKSECGIYQYNKDNPDKKLELKWKVYESGKQE